MNKHSALEEVITPLVEHQGYEFVGLECISSDSHAVLSVYVDKPNGISIDECGKISQKIAYALSVESDLLPEKYRLEVSSPGLYRKLFNCSQCIKQIGSMIKFKLKVPKETQRNFKGILEAVDLAQNTLVVAVENGQMRIDFGDIDQINVEPQW